MEGDGDDFVDGIDFASGSSSDNVGGVQFDEFFVLLLLTVSFVAADGAALAALVAVAAVSFGKNTK